MSIFDEKEDMDSNGTFSNADEKDDAFADAEKRAEENTPVEPQMSQHVDDFPRDSFSTQSQSVNNSSYPYGGSNFTDYGASSHSSQNPSQPYGNGGSAQQYPYGSNQQYSYPQNAPLQNNGYAYQKQGNVPGKKKGGVVFLIVAVILFFGIITGVLIGLFGIDSKKPDVGNTVDEVESLPNVNEFVTDITPETPPVASNTSTGVLAPKDIFLKVKESSVGILVYGANKSIASEGTGIIMAEDNDGKYTYIVTCAHVISDKNTTLMVQLYNGKDYAAQVIGYDVKTDIGVIRIEESGLKIPEYGDSTKLSVGDTVYAIGNPGGTEFANSFTNGMISAIDRPVSSSSAGYTMECIQHTAAINPGNSGGALVNEYGQVVGVNSMKIIANEYEGMGFSVPSSVFMNIVNEIIANGYVSNRPKLGITYVPASSDQSYAMYVAIKGLPSGSIIVYSISKDSGLNGTDVQEGDLIVAVNGKNLDSPSDLSEYIEKCKVGDTLTLKIVRINKDYTSKEFSVNVKLSEDRGDSVVEEETASYFGDNFGNGGNSSGGYNPYQDFFDDFFNRFYNGR